MIEPPLVVQPLVVRLSAFQVYEAKRRCPRELGEAYGDWVKRACIAAARQILLEDARFSFIADNWMWNPLWFWGGNWDDPTAVY